MNKEWKYLALLFQIFSVITYAENNPPIGNIESVIGSVIHGWACDPDEPNKAIEVHFYADNTFDKGGNIIGIVVANLPSDATINAVCKGETSHRFEYTFQRYEKSRIGPGDHPVYAYAIDTANGVNPLLYNSPAILNVTGAKITLHAVDNINTNCHFYADQNWNLIQPALGTCDSWAAWIIRGTNEDSAFFNPKYFLPNDSSLNGTEHASSMRPYWFYEFHLKEDGTYQVGWVVDKVNFPQDLNQYSAAFINDVNLTTLPDIGDNIFIDIRVGLFANEQVYDSSVGLSKNRTAIGILSSV